jgi:hypothetical protein
MRIWKDLEQQKGVSSKSDAINATALEYVKLLEARRRSSFGCAGWLYVRSTTTRSDDEEGGVADEKGEKMSLAAVFNLRVSRVASHDSIIICD